jgi:YVTN family beta-propeller protein
MSAISGKCFGGHTSKSVRAFDARRFLGLVFLGLAGLALPASSTSLLETVPVGKFPGPIVVNPAGHLVYVLNESSNSVSVLDSEELVVKKTIPVGKSPVAIAANPVTNMVYVANSGSGTISAITGTGAAVTWTVGGKPSLLVVDSALGKAFVGDPSRNQVEIVDSTKGKVLATIPTALPPSAMALNIATHQAWVACAGASGSVVVIDGTTDTVVTTVSGALIPNGINSISVDPVTNVAVVASPTASGVLGVAAIDGASGYSVTDEGNTDNDAPYATAYDPGGLFFVSNNNAAGVAYGSGDGLFLVGDSYFTNSLFMTSLAVNPTSNQIATLVPSSQTAFLIDLTNPIFTTYLHTLATGVNPTQLAFDPETSRLFVANSGGNSVSVFDITPRFVVPAYEGPYSGNSIGYNYVDINPATGNVYTLRLGNLFAINEKQAAAGYLIGNSENSAGVTTIPLGSIYSSAIAVNPASNKIYVGDSTGFFYSVNGTTNKATALTVLPSSASVRSLAVNSAANQIVAWDYTSGDVFVLDSGKDTLLKTIVPGQQFSQAYVLTVPSKDLAYLAAGTFYVLDPTAGTVVTSIALSGTATGAAINPALSRCYVTMTGGLVYVINTSTNAIATTITLTSTPTAVAVNPVTGNFYVAFDDTSNVTHVQVYSGTSNTLIADLLGSTYPEIGNAADIRANPLTNTVYVGGDSGQQSAGIAAIDGQTNVVSAVTPNPYDEAAHALKVDLGTSILAGAGYSYTSLWFPTSDLTGTESVPISVTIQGVKDASTIATTPLFRTTNTKPSFTISATGNFSENAAALAPPHGFYQVDGWQGTWTAVPLTAKSGSATAKATIKLPAALTTGQHILYSYASTGDVATVQSGDTGANSAVISPIGFVVFTVEK